MTTPCNGSLNVSNEVKRSDTKTPIRQDTKTPIRRKVAIAGVPQMNFQHLNKFTRIYCMFI